MGEIKKPHRLTLKELKEPIQATCARCRCKHAVIIAEPFPKGQLICPRCTLGIEHAE